MQFTYFIGCDVSKNELDFSVLCGKDFLFHKEISNTVEAIDEFVRDLKKLPKFSLSEAVFCMEHTGIYNNPLLVYLNKKKGHICLETATQIKNSLGNIRGKNDKVDSKRIAEYAYKNRDELRLWQPKRDVIQKLAHFTATRNRLLSAKKMLLIPLKEAVSFVKSSINKQNEKLCDKTINAIETDLNKVDKAINDIIVNDEQLSRLFRIITSVEGIGKVTATQIIISTNEFIDINDAKKFACYSGVAPFVRESGLLKGKATVSHMANKDVKRLLHMAALTAIRYSRDLKAYYERKVVDEKKNKMSVINAVRNKLVLRIFACVNQNREYEKNYTTILV